MRRHLIVFCVMLALLAAACGGGDDLATEATAEPTTTTAEPTSTTTTVSADGILVVCGQTLESGVTTIECEGMSFDVAVPEECLSASCGVIVDAHPTSMTKEDEERGTSMQGLGNAAGYVVVQPQSPQRQWDYPVDSARIRSMLDQLIEALEIDPDRVHIGGISGGGYMAWVFVCDHADLIASAAPLGAGTATDEDQSCDFDEGEYPTGEVDILLVHGRNDTIVPFDTAIAQRDLVLSAWDLSDAEVLIDEPFYRWTRWTNPRGTVFELVEYEAGHCAPGVDYLFGCSAEDPFHYGEIALDFYIAHPKGD